MYRIRFVNDLGNGHSGYIEYQNLYVQTISGQSITTQPNGPAGSDAFGRLRTSNPVTIFDSQHRYQENDKWSTASGNSGSTTYQVNKSAVDLNVTTASGDYIYRETKRVFPYQPGKSLLINNSFVFATAQTNLRQRVGYFGVDNGIYFEQEDTTLYMVLRSKVSGSVVNTRIAQGDWNGDKLNGLGLSGLILNPTKGNIFWTDVEWLGVGDVRCGFIINGQLIVCHTFKNANEKDSTYMTTAALPLRQEIENTDTIASGTSAQQICASVVSEGGYTAAGQTYSIDRGATPITLATAGTTYPVISIRLNSSRLDAVIILSEIYGVITSNDRCKWTLLKNATLTGASYTTHSNGNVDYDTSATSLSGGTVINGSYINLQGENQVGGPADFTYQLGRTIAGVSDVLTLAVTPISNNTNVLFGLKWIEAL